MIAAVMDAGAGLSGASRMEGGAPLLDAPSWGPWGVSQRKRLPPEPG